MSTDGDYEMQREGEPNVAPTPQSFSGRSGSPSAENEPGVSSSQPPPTVDDIQTQQRNINQLQQQLNAAYDTGNRQAAAAIAAQITDVTLNMRQMQSAYDAHEQTRVAERKWLDDAITSIHSIKQVIEAHRMEVERTQSRLKITFFERTDADATKQRKAHSNNIFNPFASATTQAHSQHTADGYEVVLARAKKTIKEAQVTLEQQTLRVDTIDPSNALSGRSSQQLIQTVKAMRKDTVQYIQSQLDHVDSLERHIRALEDFHAFLSTKPQAQYSYTPQTYSQGAPPASSSPFVPRSAQHTHSNGATPNRYSHGNDEHKRR